MPADEVTHGADVDGSRARTGPRHAAPRRPLFTRFHMPAGKAIASVAMPTAVIVGMGFTSTLALADNNGTATSNSQKAAEYQDCVDALKDSGKASASPSPSASESTGEATPAPTASAEAKDDGTPDPGRTSSPDSGSDEKPAPEPTATSGSSGSGSDSGSGGGTATPDPSASASATKSTGGVLGTLGDTLGDLLTGGKTDSGTSASPEPSPSPSAGSSSGTEGGAAGTVKDTVEKTTKTVTDTVTGTVKDTTGKVSETAGDAAKTVEDTTKAAGDAAGSATPSPSASATTSPEDCPAATDAESGVDNKVPVADDPWYLDASSLTLKGADYKGIVEVKTANGTTKKVLKYVISGGTDIGDLHQTVKDKQAGKTYHVQAAKGSTSTITGGDTVMYTESISGNLLGLIPVTFSPDSPPPLNIPLIYFTKVHVVQAAQFGGDLHVPGMHLYTTD
ncbi:hypothetical protein NHG22_04560 [Streptomyces sp. ATE26]|uniref:hypothetical protein n=1 Tax=unclassified Streptomyces TaxID=2593676 RepID=UPI001575E1D8|nr:MULTISPECIES: hypothetical protein [unclassified Streptomyces]MDI1453088.1 hypothetical protein [Streptomyces sp. ATE26]